MPDFPFIPFPFHPPTPEEMEEMQRQQTEHEMRLTEFRHSFQRMFEEMDENQLSTIQTMFHILADGTDSRLASYWEGIIAWERKKRFNICSTCGVDHDKEILSPDTGDHAADPTEPTRPVMESTPAAAGFQVLDDGTLVIPPEIRETMNQYHLDDTYTDRGESSDPNHQQYIFLGFKCTGIQGGPKDGCGVVYPTIQDRMIKGPEECSGCFQRTMHG